MTMPQFRFQITVDSTVVDALATAVQTISDGCSKDATYGDGEVHKVYETDDDRSIVMSCRCSAESGPLILKNEIESELGDVSYDGKIVSSPVYEKGTSRFDEEDRSGSTLENF